MKTQIKLAARWMLAGFAVFLLVAAPAAEPMEWRAVQKNALLVKPGSILDFSAEVDSQMTPVVVKGEHLFRADKPGIPLRLPTASFAFTPAAGSMPLKIESRVIAAELKRRGYRAVRFHFVDATLMAGRQGDFDYDPEQLDRFFYLAAEVKKQGLYWFIDIASSPNGAYGSVFPDRWVKKYDLVRDVYWLESSQLHWQKLVDTLWARKNPYTGMSTLEDPALIGAVLANEGGANFRSIFWGDQYPGYMAPGFREWLTAKYGDIRKLRHAWREELGVGEREFADVEAPKSRTHSGRRMSDFMEYVAQGERKAIERLSAYLRDKGYQGLIGSHNNYPYAANAITRSALGWVDMHAYHDEPSKFVARGSKITGNSSIDDDFRFLRLICAERQADRPFTVTEYGHPFWSPWRREGAFVVPAVAAFQGWSAISNFAESTIVPAYGDKPAARRQAIHPFSLGLDPIALGSEVIAGILYREGIRPATGSELHSVSVRDIYARGDVHQVDSQSARCFETKIALRLVDVPMASALSPGQRNARGVTEVEYQRNVQAVPKVVRSVKGDWESLAEGQWLVNHKDRAMAVVGEKFAGLAWSAPGSPVSAGSLQVQGASGAGLVFFSARDGRALVDSERILVVVLSDARNTAMRFQDREETVLEDLGRLPARIEHLKFEVKTPFLAGRRWELAALDLTGTEIEDGRQIIESNSARLFFDNFTPSGQTVQYFQLLPTKTK